MGNLPILILLAASVAVKDDQAPLRSGCEPGDPVVAQLHGGDAVQIRFALAGGAVACYKVSVTSQGRTLEGYLPASAIIGLDQFERARGAAPAFDNPQRVRQDMESLRKDASGVGGDLASKATELLQANQPGEALALLEKALRLNRRDAGVLSLAGLAAYQNDQVRRAIDYWNESLALAPSPGVERLRSAAQKELAADQSGEKLVGIRFLLRYDPGEVAPEQARSLMAMLEEQFGYISEQLGCRADERIIAVLQGREAYHRATGSAEWSGGQYDGRIRVALLDGNGVGRETRRALSHEMVHACLANLGSWPAWLHEGMAQKLSGDTLAPARRAELDAMLRAGGIPRLQNLGQTFSRMSARHASVAYTMALRAAELLMDMHGTLGVRNLLQNPDRLSQVAAEIDRRMRP